GREARDDAHAPVRLLRRLPLSPSRLHDESGRVARRAARRSTAARQLRLLGIDRGRRPLRSPACVARRGVRLMRYDLQVHTDASPCSATPPKKVAAAAADAGLDGIVVTDHDTLANVDRVREHAPARLDV